MATTTSTTVPGNNTWTSVGTSSGNTDLALGNHGNRNIEVAVDGSQPAVSTQGHVLRRQENINITISNGDSVWVRTRYDAIVVFTL